MQYMKTLTWRRLRDKLNEVTDESKLDKDAVILLQGEDVYVIGDFDEIEEPGSYHPCYGIEKEDLMLFSDHDLPYDEEDEEDFG